MEALIAAARSCAAVGRSGVVVFVVFAFFDACGRPGERAASDVLSRAELRCGEALASEIRSLVAAEALGKE